MSRDQKPRRSVMIDSVPDALEPKQVVAIDGDPAGALPVSARPSLLLPSIVFLLASAGGACAITLVSAGKIW